MTEDTPKGDWLAELQRLLAELSAAEVVNFELSHGKTRIRIRRRHFEPLPGPPPATPSPHQIVVRSPLTGIFYRTPAPNGPPYVNEGDWVEEGQVVGLVEAMKIFNEIKAEVVGRVVAILAQSGQVVHQGDPLITLEKEAS